jgi:hypothetical protein
MLICTLIFKKIGFEIRDPRSGIQDLEKNFFESRIQGPIRHRIPDPYPQHLIGNNSFRSTADSGIHREKKEGGMEKV